MFMTPDEVADMTGYLRPKDQVRWLQAEKFGYVLGADGKPKVPRQSCWPVWAGMLRRKDRNSGFDRRDDR